MLVLPLTNSCTGGGGSLTIRALPVCYKNETLLETRAGSAIETQFFGVVN